MTSKDFFQYWIKAYEIKKNEICSAWDSGSWKKYTDVLSGSSNSDSVLVEVNKQIKQKHPNYDFYQEYYSCDAVFYDKDDILSEEIVNNLMRRKRTNAPGNAEGTWIKSIKIHFEHENNIKTSWQEIIQFCIIPGELNVLITYPDETDDANIAITCYQDILNQANFKKDVLIVFGTHKKNSKDIVWTGYTYKKNKLTQIKNINQ